MKRIFIFTTFISQLIFAQNYQTVYPSLTAYFKPLNSIAVIAPFSFCSLSDDKFIRTIKIVEKENTLDEIIYENIHEINTEDYQIIGFEPCYYPDMYSWIGNQIVVNENGMNVFFNRNNDSIFISTSITLNGSCKFYKCSNGSYYQADVTDISLIQFLGVDDSAKTFVLQYYNSFGEPQYSVHNGREIIVTQHYGIYKTINFRDFPDFGGNTYQVVDHVLIGLSNLETGYKKLTFGDIYDFNINDEFHYYGYTHVSGNPVYQSWTINKILNKTSYPNAVNYLIERNYVHTTPTSWEHEIDTISQTYFNLSTFVRATETFETINQGNDIDYYIATMSSFNNRQQMITCDNAFFEWDEGSQCYRLWTENYVFGFTKYIEGCGVATFFTSYDGSWEVTSELNLVYFKKGTEEWGIPILITGTDIQKVPKYANKLMIKPNPSSNSCAISRIEWDQTERLELLIYNCQGQLQLNITNPDKIININTSDWAEGIYFCKVVKNNKDIESGKLIIKH